jgi:uncharacterized protein (TIGR03086 family)
MTTTTPSASDRPATTTDPRPAFLAAARIACDIVAGVSPDQLSDPTPCTEFDVRALLGHLVAVLHRVASVASGEPAIGQAPLVTDVPDDGWGAAARAAVDDVRAAWSDPAVLDREMRLPFGTLPGAAALASYTGELSTHTWDLAVATGQSPAWDEQVLAGALRAIRGKLPTAERPPGVPFAEAVPVPDDAPLIDRLVAWQGRDPHWRPGPG